SQSGMVRHWLKERNEPRKAMGPTNRPQGQTPSTAPAPGAQRSSNAPDAAATANVRPLPDAELAVEAERESPFVTDEVTAPTHWKKSIFINALGAVATFVVLCVFI